LSKKSELALFVKVRQSQSLLIFLVLLHSVSALSVFMIAAVLWFKVALWFCIIGSGYFYWCRYQNQSYCFAIKYSPEFLWQLIGNDEKPLNFKILKSTVMTSFLIVLHVKTDNTYRYFLVLADSTDDESFRKLHVLLKINPENKDDS